MSTQETQGVQTLLTAAKENRDLVIAKRREMIAVNLGQIQVYIPNPGEIHEQIERHIVQAEQLYGQADRAVIESKPEYAEGGSLIKIIRGQDKTANEYRRSIVDPINKFVKFFNSLFKDAELVRGEATDMVKRKIQVWSDAETARERAEEEERIRFAEEAALKRAETTEEAVDQDAILEVASEIIEEHIVNKPKNIARGQFGATTSTRHIIAGEVRNVRELCSSIAGGSAPESLVTFSKSGLNALAQKLHDQKKSLLGLEIIVKDQVVVR